MESDIRDNARFTIDGVEFVTGFAEQPDADFTIVKSPEMLARYEQPLATMSRPRILEVGMAFGGSMAWLHLVADPTLLVGIDVTSTPIAPLTEYIDARGLNGVVPEYGLDQADRGAVTDVLDRHFGNEPIDLVIDDASHEYGASRTLFETVFPRVRPGGTYLIEDWKWESELACAIHLELERTGQAPPPAAADVPSPLTRLALEVVLARAETVDIIDEVRCDNSWIQVRRGSADLDPSTFSLARITRDYHRLLR